MDQHQLRPIGKLLPNLQKRIWTMLPDFDEIMLTEEETGYAIYDARCVKYYEVKDHEEKQQTAQLLLDWHEPFTTSELRDYVLKNNPHFKVDQQSEKKFNLLCQYFANELLH